MIDKPDSFVVGDIGFKGDLDRLGAILAAGGLPNSLGAYAIRLAHFPASFEIAWVGNVAPELPYHVDACCYGMAYEAVAPWCVRLAAVLRQQGIAFEFAHCNSEQEELALYASMQDDQAGSDWGDPDPAAG